jgi:hypothetical protein
VKGNILVNSGLETGTLTGFQRPWKNSGLEKGEYLGKLRAEKQGHQPSHKYLRRIPGWGKVIVPTTYGNLIPSQEEFNH